MGKTIYTDDYIKNYFTNINTDYELINIKYDKNGSRTERFITLKHKLCGKIFDIRVSKFFVENQRCSCLRKRDSAMIKTKEDFQNFLDKKFGKNEYTIISEYLGRKSPLTLKHSCGETYTIKRAEFLLDKRSKNSGLCPVCTLGNKNTEDILNKKLIKYANVKLAEPFVPGKNMFLVENLTCHHKYLARNYDLFKEGLVHGCPICNPVGTSKGQSEVEDYIKTFYTGEIKKKFRLERQELDIYLPDKKLGIEYDGLYWHCEKHIEDNYSIKKTKFFKDKGIRVIHIFEDEWLYKKEQCKDKLKSIISPELNTKIYARKCKIAEISKIEKSDFLNQNHIQGNDKANYQYGLYYQDNLVAVMTFSKLRKVLGNEKNIDGHYELSRYAGKIGYTILGGFSKLVDYFIKKENPESLVTYADIRWSSLDKNLYSNNQYFKYDHETQPSYYYTKDFNHRLYRYNFRKNNLKNMPGYDIKKSERKIMNENKYYRVYDCGTLVYKYTKKEQED